MDATFFAALFALSAGMAWGASDFTGGMVTRRIGAIYTMFVSYLVASIIMIILALALREPFPSPVDLTWGTLAGLFGMAGFGFLLRGFATGRMGIVAPLSAVLASALPVVFSIFREGLPRPLQMGGFGLAIVSIWLLSRPEKLGGRPAGLGMGVLAGLGFGSFFIALDQIGENAVLWPLAAGRLSSCLSVIVFALLTRQPLNPPTSALGLLILLGILDVGGNLFFLLAVQTGRLDVAAVLASLYPAVTAILARLIAKEHMNRLQAIGLAMAILAIVSITI
jgi:drug/metabolite transporter (DMT)-like permease